MQHNAHPTSAEQDICRAGVSRMCEWQWKDFSLHVNIGAGLFEGVLLCNLGFKLLQANVVKIANYFKSFMLMGRCLSFIIAEFCMFSRKFKHFLKTKSVAPRDKLMKGWLFLLSSLGTFIIPLFFLLLSSTLSAFICYSVTSPLLRSHKDFRLRSLQFYHLICVGFLINYTVETEITSPWYTTTQNKKWDCK